MAGNGNHDTDSKKSELASAELEKLGVADHGGLDDSNVG
jgi:hypothetical protein